MKHYSEAVRNVTLVTKNVLESIHLVRLELVWWTEAEPPHVDAPDAWPAATSTAAKFRRWTRTSPRLECLHEQ